MDDTSVVAHVAKVARTTAAGKKTVVLPLALGDGLRSQDGTEGVDMDASQVEQTAQTRDPLKKHAQFMPTATRMTSGLPPDLVTAKTTLPIKQRHSAFRHAKPNLAATHLKKKSLPNLTGNRGNQEQAQGHARQHRRQAYVQGHDRATTTRSKVKRLTAYCTARYVPVDYIDVK